MVGFWGPQERLTIDALERWSVPELRSHVYRYLTDDQIRRSVGEDDLSAVNLDAWWAMEGGNDSTGPGNPIHLPRIAKLVLAIRNGALVVPLKIDADESQCCYCVTDGHHRIRALQYLKRNSFPAQLRGNGEALIELRQLVARNQRTHQMSEHSHKVFDSSPRVFPSETITKIDAAERQIRTAIRVFFEDIDLVSVVTLARAGAEILRDIGLPQGIRDQLLDSEIVVDGKEREYRDWIRREQNFLKHANKDPDATFEFRPDAVPLTLFCAVDLLWRVGGRDVAETRAFLGWFLATYPDLIKEEHRDAARARALSGRDKKSILDGINGLRVLEEIGEWPPDQEKLNDPTYAEKLYDRGIRMGDRGLTTRPRYRITRPNRRNDSIE